MDSHRDRHTDKLIAILCTPPEGEVNKSAAIDCLSRKDVLTLFHGVFAFTERNQVSTLDIFSVNEWQNDVRKQQVR